MTRPGLWRRAQAAAVWTLGHLARFWTLGVAAVILAVSWQALRQIHIGAFRAALHSLEVRWLGVAAAATILNVAVMGCYDVFAFRHTTARAFERWRFGAVAFAWSNFLTLGPLAGPAIRFWLYRPAVERPADLRGGVLSVTVAFASGLVGWTAAALAFGAYGLPLVAAGAAVATVAAAWIGSAIGRRLQPFAGSASGARQIVAFAAIGWTDWLLAAAAFVACVRATGQFVPLTAAIRDFFVGQLVGLASLIPGGFGTSDAFWLARVPLPHSVTAAALMAYRVIYYVGPWALASLVLLAWAMRRSPERVTVARRSVGGLVAGAGILIMLSSASPALHARLILLERFVPLPLVEAGQLAAALAGLFVLVLARGLSRGYRTAFRATVGLLLLAAGASILKGLDWEESVVLGAVAIAAASQAAIFTRDSRGDWLEGTDLGVACAALAMFLAFGVVSHHVGARAFHRMASFGYRLQSQRFVRTAASMAFAIGAAAVYILVRPRVEFQPPTDREIDDVLEFNGRHGEGTTALMVANGDKAVFRAGDVGCALYRTIGPYLAVFSDPVVRSPADRGELLEALLLFAADLDRRVLFYQISVEWVPLLHDRGYHFFKLGEEAHVPLDRVTTDGHEGKAVRQVLRRAERDGVPVPRSRAVSGRRGPPAAANHLRRLAADQGRHGTAVFDRVVQRRVPAPLPVRRRGNRRRGTPPCICQPAGRTAAAGTVGGLDAIAE